jgi:hypothetical protein
VVGVPARPAHGATGKRIYEGIVAALVVGYALLRLPTGAPDLTMYRAGLRALVADPA